MSGSRNLYKFFGLIFIAFGIMFNEWFLARLFSSDSEITTISFKVAIWLIDILFILTGSFLVFARNKSFIRELCINLCVSVISIFAIFFILELLFPFFLPYLPLNLQAHLDASIRTLAQNSKKGLIPKNYIAILGDSYAQGIGDWLLNSNEWKNEKHHSVHLINNALDVDVVSFGSGGIGSIEGIVRFPVCILETLKQSFKMEDPKIFLIYFYEGNDLTDNIIDLYNNKYFNNVKEKSKLNKNEFNQFLQTRIKNKFGIVKMNLIASRFFLELFKNAVNKLSGKPIDSAWHCHRPQKLPGKYNLAEINHKQVILPKHLQAPPLALNGDKTKIAVQVFEYSLQFLAKQFPQSSIVVIYIPSVLSCYKLKSDVSIENLPWFRNRRSVYPAYLVEEKSSSLAKNIENICKNNNIKFLDTRPYIKLSALQQPVHGPCDWCHFNKYGYEKFSECIVSYLYKEGLAK